MFHFILNNDSVLSEKKEWKICMKLKNKDNEFPCFDLSFFMIRKLLLIASAMHSGERSKLLSLFNAGLKRPVI